MDSVPKGSGCLDLETLAAFVEGGGGDREAVVAHLDHCERCYKLVVEVARTLETTRPKTAPSQLSSYLGAILHRALRGFSRLVSHLLRRESLMLTRRSISLLAALALPALAAGCGGCKTPESPSADAQAAAPGDARQAVVIGIHGLRPKPPENELPGLWRDALQKSLAVNARADAEFPRFDFDFAYWAEDQTRSPVECVERRDSTVWDLRSRLVGLLEEARNASDRKASEEVGQAKAPSIIEKLWEGISPDAIKLANEGAEIEDLQRLFGEVLNLTQWQRAQDDLERYYRNPEAIRDRLVRVLETHAREDRRILLIAHSMGSFVAYDVLRTHDFEHEPKVNHFVTFGSPLGLRAIKARQENTDNGPFERRVEHWSNLADPFDPIAIDSDLDSDYDWFRPRIKNYLVNTRIPSKERFSEALHQTGGDLASKVFCDLEGSFRDRLGIDDSGDNDETRQRKRDKALELARLLLNQAKREASLWQYHSYCGYLQTPEMAQILRDFLAGQA